MNKIDLILTLQSSFLGAIDKDIRAIAYDYTDDTIMIYAYLDREPNENDYEIIDVAVTEIMAILPSVLYQKIEIVETYEPIGKLENHKGWFFVRYEG